MDDDEFSPIVIGMQQTSDGVKAASLEEKSPKNKNNGSDSNILFLNKVEESPSKRGSGEKQKPDEVDKVGLQPSDGDAQIDLQDAMNKFLKGVTPGTDGMVPAPSDDNIVLGAMPDQQQLFQQMMAAQQNFP